MKRLFAAQAKYIKYLMTKKGRRKENFFVVEGIKAVTELINSDIQVEFIVYDSDFSSGKFVENNPQAGIIDSFSGNVSQLSKLGSAEGIIAVCKMPQSLSLAEFFKSSSNILVLCDISDPGNMGTIIRTACWFGLDGILILGNSTEIYSPKVIRSSMGAVFHMPFIKSDSFQDLEKYSSDFKKIGTFLDLPNDYIHDDKNKKMIFLGNEAKGLRNDLKNFTDCNYRIGSKSKFDSLNVSVAAGIILNNIFNFTEDIRCS